MVQKLDRSGSDSANSKPEQPSPFWDRSTSQPIALFYLTQGRLNWVTQVEAESAPSQGRLCRVTRVEAESPPSQDQVKPKFHIIKFLLKR